MSLTCPKCGTEVEQDFGLVNCPGCNAVLAIDVDGNIQVAEQESGEAPEGLAGPAPSVSGEVADGEFQDLDELLGTSAAEVNSDLTRGASAMEASMEISEAPPIEETLPPNKELGPLEEITDFGNRDTSAGPFTYTLTLENIDLGSTRQRLQEAVSEPRFGWDTDEVMKRVRAGKMVLEGLSPAQAVMLIRLLRGSQIQISWSQHVYS